MRETNRGDVPAPHVPLSRGKTTVVADPTENVVFDSGSLSFVQDWVDGAGGEEAAAEIDPAREDPRQSNPNRRLGVGAQPKKSKLERPEPSALERKLLRKRQRKELSDAVAGEMGTHGIADDDKDGEGDSKTASFKGKKRGRGRPAGLAEQNAVASTTKGEAKINGMAKVNEPASKSRDGMTRKEDGADVEEQGTKQGRKRKARRKKGKSEVTETTDVSEVAAEMPQPSAATPDKPSVAEAEVGGGNTEEPELETKKQRRGWGKARSKPAAPTNGGRGEAADGTAEGEEANERRPRKKTRSRQKNIRKDKRSVEDRPAYLRTGNLEFSGRGLTDETRKFLGLPQDDFGDAPPAGWGKPGKVGENPGWVIDRQPTRKQIPKVEAARSNDRSGAGVDSGEDVDSRRKAAHAVEAKPPSKSKYKNLTLPPRAKRDKKDKKMKSSNSSGVIDGEATKREGKGSRAAINKQD